MIAVANGVVTAATESEVVGLVIAGGVLAFLVRAPRTTSSTASMLVPIPALFVTGLAGPVGAATLWKVLWYFTTAGLFVFGSGLAVVPFLHGGVVATHGWLSERQFLDAVAVAMITPGPVVITVAFIGYLVAGPAGAMLAAIGVFLPCFLIVVIVAPYYRRLAGKARIKAFISGVTAGAIGAIAGAVVVLARKSITDLPTLLIAAVALVLLVKVKRLPEPLLILASGVVGLLVKRGAG